MLSQIVEPLICPYMRHVNSTIRQFSWISPNGNCKSRTDLRLITQKIIFQTPTSEHRIIHVSVKPGTERAFRQKYWKFKSNVLKDEQYCHMGKKIFSDDKRKHCLLLNEMGFFHESFGIPRGAWGGWKDLF